MTYIPFSTRTGITKYLPQNDFTKEQNAEWSKLPMKVRIFIRNQYHLNYEK